MSSKILKYKADYRTFAFVAIYYLAAYLCLLNTQAIYTNGGVLGIFFLCAFVCVMSFICAVAVHNTIHCPIFYDKTHNKLFQYVLSLAYGYSVSSYVPGHNFSHHKEVQTAKDGMRTTKLRFKWNFLNQLLFFFFVTSAILTAEKRWTQKMKNVKKEWYNQWLTEMILVHGVKIGTLFVDPIGSILFIWIPHVYAAWGIVSTNMWQHDGCDVDHKYNHSRTFTGPLLNFLTMNNGYHGAHHDRPSLHWSLLPAYHEENIAPYIHPNLNQKSLFIYLWKANIYPGKRLNYDGTPFILPPAVDDIDWVADVMVSDKKHAFDFGAESATVNQILNTTEQTLQDAS